MNTINCTAMLALSLLFAAMFLFFGWGVVAGLLLGVGTVTSHAALTVMTLVSGFTSVQMFRSVQ